MYINCMRACMYVCMCMYLHIPSYIVLEKNLPIHYVSIQCIDDFTFYLLIATSSCIQALLMYIRMYALTYMCIANTLYWIHIYLIYKYIYM